MTEKDNVFRIEFNGKKYIVVREKMQYDALMNPDPTKAGEWLKMIGPGNMLINDPLYEVLLKVIMIADEKREEFTIG